MCINSMLQFFELEVKLLLIQKKRPLGLGSSHPIYLPGNVLLLRNVSQLPSALRTFPDFRQALASFLSFRLSSLTYHSYARFVFRSLRQLQTLSFVSLQFFVLEVKLLFDAKKETLPGLNCLATSYSCGT